VCESSNIRFMATEKETRTYIEKERKKKKKHNKITNNGERLSVGITSHRQNINVLF